MKYRGRKSIAKDRRLEKSNAWLAESGSQEDDEEIVWQEYLHSIRDRLDIETLLYNDYMRSLKNGVNVLIAMPLSSCEPIYIDLYSVVPSSLVSL